MNENIFWMVPMRTGPPDVALTLQHSTHWANILQTVLFGLPFLILRLHQLPSTSDHTPRPLICCPLPAPSLLLLICRCFYPPFFGHNFPKGEQKWFSIAPCMTNGGNMLKSSQKCPWEDKWIFSRIINLINKFACIFIRAIEVFPAQLDERCCVITSSFTFCHPLPFVWITEKRQSVCVCVCVCVWR